MTLWGASTTASALQTMPVLSHDPVTLEVDFGPPQSISPSLSEGIRGLYQKCHFYDVVLIVGDKRFPAHQAVIASMSAKLCDDLREALRLRADGVAQGQQKEEVTATAPSAEAPSASAETTTTGAPVLQEQKPASTKCPASAGTLELRLRNVENPEAAHALLDYIYGLGAEYQVSSDEVNKDVLRLAQQYGLTGLEALAERRLAANISTDNVVSRLATCQEFNLWGLFGLVADELIASPLALQLVSSQTEVMRYPEILQQLLIRASEHYKPDLEGEKTATAGSRKRAAPAGNEKRAEKAAKASSGAAVVGGA